MEPVSIEAKCPDMFDQSEAAFGICWPIRGKFLGPVTKTTSGQLTWWSSDHAQSVQYVILSLLCQCLYSLMWRQYKDEAQSCVRITNRSKTRKQHWGWRLFWCVYESFLLNEWRMKEGVQVSYYLTLGCLFMSECDGCVMWPNGSVINMSSHGPQSLCLVSITADQNTALLFRLTSQQPHTDWVVSSENIFLYLI